MNYIKISVTIILAILHLGCKKQFDSNNELIVSNGRVPTANIINVQWKKSFGSSLSDQGFVVAASSDGTGYFLAGYSAGNDFDVTGNHGKSDAMIMKVDLPGTKQKLKLFGGSETEYAEAITATQDGGCIFAGFTASTDGDLLGKTNKGGWDLWVVKLTSNLDIEWQTTLGGTGTEDVGIGQNAIKPLGDGGYLISATTSSNNGDVSFNHGGNDIWIVRLTSTGSLVWEKTFGGSGSDREASVLSFANGFLLCGTTSSIDGDLQNIGIKGGTDVWLFEIDNNGTLQSFNKTYGGSGNENGGDVLPVSGGAYVFSGVARSNNGDISGNHGLADAWVVKIGSGGSIIWQKCFGGNDGDGARLSNIDADGNILLVGNTFSKGSRTGDISSSQGGEDGWVLRVDAAGNKLNSINLGGSGGDIFNSAIPALDGGFLSLGASDSKDGDVTGNHGGRDFWLVKYKF